MIVYLWWPDDHVKLDPKDEGKNCCGLFVEIPAVPQSKDLIELDEYIDIFGDDTLLGRPEEGLMWVVWYVRWQASKEKGAYPSVCVVCENNEMFNELSE